MIEPGVFIEELINITEQNRELLGLAQKSVEGSENLKAEDLRPPYIIFYASFDEDSEIMDDGTATSIPVTISAACVSTEHKTSKDALSEALIIAVKLIRLIQKEYTLQNIDGVMEPVYLKSKPKPIHIGRNSAELSSIIADFYYTIPVIQNV